MTTKKYVRCIDNSLGAGGYLVVGQVYEAFDHSSSSSFNYLINEIGWIKSRFVEVKGKTVKCIYPSGDLVVGKMYEVDRENGSTYSIQDNGYHLQGQFENVVPPQEIKEGQQIVASPKKMRKIKCIDASKHFYRLDATPLVLGQIYEVPDNNTQLINDAYWRMDRFEEVIEEQTAPMKKVKCLQGTTSNKDLEVGKIYLASSYPGISDYYTIVKEDGINIGGWMMSRFEDVIEAPKPKTKKVICNDDSSNSNDGSKTLVKGQVYEVPVDSEISFYHINGSKWGTQRFSDAPEEQVISNPKKRQFKCVRCTGSVLKVGQIYTLISDGGGYEMEGIGSGWDKNCFEEIKEETKVADPILSSNQSAEATSPPIKKVFVKCKPSRLGLRFEEEQIFEVIKEDADSYWLNDGKDSVEKDRMEIVGAPTIKVRCINPTGTLVNRQIYEVIDYPGYADRYQLVGELGAYFKNRFEVVQEEAIKLEEKKKQEVPAKKFVRCINDGGYTALTIGVVYEVARESSSGGVPCYQLVGGNREFWQSRFEIVQEVEEKPMSIPEPPKAAKIKVKCIRPDDLGKLVLGQIYEAETRSDKYNCTYSIEGIKSSGLNGYWYQDRFEVIAEEAPPKIEEPAKKPSIAIGEKVRCLVSYDKLVEGKIYEVSGYNDGDIRLKGIETSYMPTRFETLEAALVSLKTKPVFVKCIRNSDLNAYQQQQLVLGKVYELNENDSNSKAGLVLKGNSYAWKFDRFELAEKNEEMIDGSVSTTAREKSSMIGKQVKCIEAVSDIKVGDLREVSKEDADFYWFKGDAYGKWSKFRFQETKKSWIGKRVKCIKPNNGLTLDQIYEVEACDEDSGSEPMLRLKGVSSVRFAYRFELTAEELPKAEPIKEAAPVPLKKVRCIKSGGSGEKEIIAGTIYEVEKEDTEYFYIKGIEPGSGWFKHRFEEIIEAPVVKKVKCIEAGNAGVGRVVLLDQIYEVEKEGNGYFYLKDAGDNNLAWSTTRFVEVKEEAIKPIETPKVEEPILKKVKCVYDYSYNGNVDLVKGQIYEVLKSVGTNYSIKGMRASRDLWSVNWFEDIKEEQPMNTVEAPKKRVAVKKDWLSYGIKAGDEFNVSKEVGTQIYELEGRAEQWNTTHFDIINAPSLPAETTIEAKSEIKPAAKKRVKLDTTRFDFLNELKGGEIYEVVSDDGSCYTFAESGERRWSHIYFKTVNEEVKQAGSIAQLQEVMQQISKQMEKLVGQVSQQPAQNLTVENQPAQTIAAKEQPAPLIKEEEKQVDTKPAAPIVKATSSAFPLLLACIGGGSALSYLNAAQAFKQQEAPKKKRAPRKPSTKKSPANQGTTTQQ